ncbi:MAG: hypothetical protein RLZZ08_180 [Pseudomonadota bacterium]|jgi:chemotaxis protein methyltransferase CheR
MTGTAIFDTALVDPSLPGISPAVYSANDFKAVARLIHDEAGILLPDGKKMLVYSRLAPLVRESGVGTFSGYLEMVRTDPVRRARTVAALTTNHTYFNRESHHFEHFADQARPALLKQLRDGGQVRLWSAGCSSGEEVWTLVLTLLGADKLEGRRILQSDIRLLASDIAPHALAAAEAAVYETEAVQAIPAPLREAWTRAEGQQTRIGDEARGMVRFRPLNLQGEWPMRGTFEVIFCRNVMIYFDLPTKERLVARFAEKLVPGGFLYIGHSERVSGPAAKLLDQVGPTIYRRRDA